MLARSLVLCFITACLAESPDGVRHQCLGDDYILNRSGCRVWCRGRIPHPSGFGMKAVDYIIADRRDGLPCIGARESDSASESTSESSESDSNETSNSTLQNVETALNEADNMDNLRTSSESSDSSDSSAHVEIVIDPLYMGVCRKGVCVPTYRK